MSKSNRYEEISHANWERRKDNYKFIYFFKKLYENKELLRTIDPKKLYENLVKLYSKKYYYVSSDPSEWLPDWVLAVIRWVKGSEFMWSPIDSLGIDLIKMGRRDLLKVLAKAGDKKAKLIKKRSKFPKELLRKTLKWTKLEDGKWLVEVIEKKEEYCEYDKIYQEYLSYIEEVKES